MHKTLAMKVLEGKSVAYEAVTYPADERDAVVVAGHLGVAPAVVFKTLVVNRPPAKPLLVMIPADRQLDLKKLARVTGDKKLKMATHAEAEALTQLKVGGISPLALLNRGFVIYIDATAADHPFIFISAGEKGINLKVPVPAVVRLLGARSADVTEGAAG